MDKNTQSSGTSEAVRLTTPDYWKSVWRKTPVRNYAGGLPWFADWIEFQQTHLPKGKMDLLEVGCANSRWLPIYARLFGYNVTGVDYDGHGCEVARQSLAQNGVAGNVVEADFFKYAQAHEGEFDVVASYGFVEHFTDDSVAQAMLRVLKPSGTLFVSVPNLESLHGLMFDLCLDWRPMHIIYSPETLRAFFAKNGFEVLAVQRVAGFGVPPPRPSGWRRWLFPLHALMWAYVLASYAVARVTGLRLRSRCMAAGIMLVARKAGAARPA